MLKILKILLINIALLTGMIIFMELSFNIAKYIKDKVKSKESDTPNLIQRGKPIPNIGNYAFHPGVGHANKLSDFKRNVNTSGLKFDNISATEIFEKGDKFSGAFKVFVLGSSTTDPLGIQYSGFRGTWVHHLFEEISKTSDSKYIVENAGTSGLTSSNELLRLITKFHSNDYDLVISFNGINEYYFEKYNYLYNNKENILASKMILEAIKDSGTLKTLDGKRLSTLGINFRNLRTYQLLKKIKSTFYGKGYKNIPQKLSQNEKDLLSDSANIWSKNIDFMHSISTAMNSKYLAILQPTLGLGVDYCKNKGKDCISEDQKYILKVRYIYTMMRQHCGLKDYCLDISDDYALVNDDSLYTDKRHPNSNGNKRIADLIRRRVVQTLSN